MLRGYFMAFLLLLPVMIVTAKEAEPMADDPALEQQVNDISKELRCLVCQNQTIADSHAELAVDLKNQVRDMVKAGQSQELIVDYMVERYGDFVLYRPPVRATTYLLWIGPFALFALGLIVLVVTIRKRRRIIVDDAPFSDQENQRLRSLLNSGGEDSRS